MTINEFQKLIERIYYERDAARGPEANFVWLVEEVGALANAVARPETSSPENLREEFADVLAWRSTLAALKGGDREAAAKEKYANGCPKCGEVPCRC